MRMILRIPLELFCIFSPIFQHVLPLPTVLGQNQQMSSQSWLAPAPNGSDDSPPDPAPLSLTGKKKRKAHQKSRSGCRTCKKRKIKCDEAEPECTQCKRFGVPCDLLPPSEWGKRISLCKSQRSSGEKRSRGRPRSDWTTIGHRVSHSSSSQDRTLSETVSPEANVKASLALNVDDLMLLHHYTTVTAATLGHYHVWGESVPKLGQHYPGVLHATLSISAYHLSRIDLQNAPKHLIQAERHYEIAVRDATAMVTHLTIDNCQAFYALAVLICFTGFAKRPLPGDLMVVARNGCTSSLHLIRGVRVVIEQFGESVIYSGFLEVKKQTPDDVGEYDPLEEEGIRKRRRTRVDAAFPGWQWRESLARLSAQLPMHPTSIMDKVLALTATRMSECFDSICETLPPAKERDTADFISAIQWVYRFDDPFIKALNEQNKTALILVGFFGVLLEVIEGFWFLDGWGKHILRELKDMLGDEYQLWLPRI